jgi:hypothetical protein
MGLLVGVAGAGAEAEARGWSLVMSATQLIMLYVIAFLRFSGKASDGVGGAVLVSSHLSSHMYVMDTS